MANKGIVHVPNAVTERIVATIASFPLGETFSIKEVQRLLPDLRQNSIASIICVKAHQGWLDRCGRGNYRVGGVHIKTQLPHGLVAEAVWAVLFTDNQRLFKRRPQVAGEAETYVNRPGVSLYGQVGSTLCWLYKSGSLERMGERGEYAYRLKPGITERPVCRH